MFMETITGGPHLSGEFTENLKIKKRYINE